jgi:carbamoyltransferase
LLKRFEVEPSDVKAVVVIGASRQAETGGGNLSKSRERFGMPKSQIVDVLNPLITLIDNLFLESRIRSAIVKKYLRDVLRSLGLQEARLEWIDHHFAHALGAFYSSGFESSLVITMDGKGDALSGSVRVFDYASDGELSIRLVSEMDEVDSMGFPYSCVTEYLGFKRLRHEGKVTGLAAFGDSSRVAHVKFPTVFVDEESQFRSTLVIPEDVRNDRSASVALWREFRSQWWSLLTKGAGLRGRYVQLKITEFLHQSLAGVDRADVAAWVQSNTESQVARHVRALMRTEVPRSISLAGGLFANVKLNQVIRETANVKEVFVLPGMGDGGLAVGPAIHLGQQRIASRKKYPGLKDVFLGSEYSHDEIGEAIERDELEVTYHADICAEIAALINAGVVVGNFDGPMEWGPRALGNRSILARPIDASINDRLNHRLRRTEFMPFAPMILDSIASEILVNYSDSDRTAEFMTITYNVKDEWRERIPAVVHIDGTARPQIVRKTISPRIHRIIEEYQRLSGLGVVINTSFNIHEEPIVESPDDAVRSLLQDAVDVLAISSFLVRRRT